VKDRPLWHYPALAAESRPRNRTIEFGAEATCNQPVKPSAILQEDPNGAFEIDSQPVAAARLAWSPDGKRLVSFTHARDPVEEKNIGYAKVWDAVAGQPEGRLDGLPARISDAAFTPDGRELALAGDDGIIRFWDPVARRQLSHDAADCIAVYCLASSSDGKLLASAGEGKGIAVRSMGTRETRLICHEHGSRVSRVSFSHDGSRMLIASSAEGVRVIDLASGELLQHLTTPRDFCRAAFDRDGKRVVIGGYGPVKVWNLETGKPEGRFSTRQAHTRTVGSIAFSPDGRYVASGVSRATSSSGRPRPAVSFSRSTVVGMRCGASRSAPTASDWHPAP
jgi:WD40 repeat protein